MLVLIIFFFFCLSSTYMKMGYKENKQNRNDGGCMEEINLHSFFMRSRAFFIFFGKISH